MIPLSWRVFPGTDLHLGQSSQRAPGVPVYLLVWFSHLAPACGSFPARPSHGGVSEQHLLVRSAGSTCGMPLIAMLIGFLLVPSIFSKQKQEEAGAIYFSIINVVHVGTRDPGIEGAFFLFLCSLKTTAKLPAPGKKLLTQLGCSKDVCAIWKT